MHRLPRVIRPKRAIWPPHSRSGLVSRLFYSCVCCWPGKWDGFNPPGFHQAPDRLPSFVFRHSMETDLDSCHRSQQKSAQGRFFDVAINDLHPVHQDVQTQPHHVHKVPIPSSALETEVTVLGEMAFLQTQGDEQEHQHAHEHVETVETREHVES